MERSVARAVALKREKEQAGKLDMAPTVRWNTLVLVEGAWDGAWDGKGQATRRPRAEYPCIWWLGAYSKCFGYEDCCSGTFKSNCISIQLIPSTFEMHLLVYSHTCLI